MLGYWFVLQCNKEDTGAIILNLIDESNKNGLNKIVGLKFWEGQHPNETAFIDTILIKFINPICKKKCEQIFDGRKVIFACKNTIDDKKTRTFLMHGEFVIAGPHLKDVMFRIWSKKSIKKTVENVALEHEQHVLPHPGDRTCTACTRAQKMEAFADQLLIEKEKLEAVIKEREAMSAHVTNLQLTASHLQESIMGEQIHLDATRKEIASLTLCTLQQGCTGDRVPIGKRGLDAAAGTSYPVYPKRSKYVCGQLGLFAAKDLYANEVIIRMDNPVSVTKKQERKLSDDFGFRHDSVVSMGPGNNSVWDMDVSMEQLHKKKTKIDIDRNHKEPLWFYMNHRNAKANVYLHFENINGLRYPVWKAKEAIKIDQELFWSYGIVPNSFKD